MEERVQYSCTKIDIGMSVYMVNIIAGRITEIKKRNIELYKDGKEEKKLVMG